MSISSFRAVVKLGEGKDERGRVIKAEARERRLNSLLCLLEKQGNAPNVEYEVQDDNQLVAIVTAVPE
jgi:hypothetical protein